MTPTKGTPDKITKEQVDAVYTNVPGASLLAAAKSLGISYINMRALLKQYGIVAKPKTRNWTRKPTDARLNDREWLKEQLRTRTYRDIAKEAGTTPGNIAYFVRKHELYNTKAERIREGMAIRYPNGRLGQEAGNWKGGRRQVGKGYWYVYIPQHPQASQEGYVMEHRLVMEQQLGRLLTPEEVVHHKNGDRSDNRVENLELTTRGQHTREHFADVTRVAKLEAEIAELRRRLGEV